MRGRTSRQAGKRGAWASALFGIASVSALLLGGCSTVPATPALSQCYSAGDETRMNHVYLDLKPEGTFKLLVLGDIGPWGEASGRWSANGSTLSFHPTASDFFRKPLPPFELRYRHGAIAVPRNAIGFWHWKPLEPLEPRDKCAEFTMIPLG